MSVIMMATYDFSPVPKHLLHKQTQSISSERSPLLVSAGGAAVTPNSEVPGKRPQNEGGGASSATASGTWGVCPYSGFSLSSPCFTGSEWVAPGLLLTQMSLYPLCSYLLADAEDAACGCP